MKKENKINSDSKKAQTDPFTVRILRNALKDAKSKDDAEELACLLIKLGESVSKNPFWNISEILLLRMAIVQCMKLEKEARSFDKLLEILEADSQLEEQSEWRTLTQNSSAKVQKGVITGLGTRLRKLGVTTAA